METQEGAFEEGDVEGDLRDYENYDGKPIQRKRSRKKKRDREREYTRKLVLRFRKEGARTKRYKDLGWQNPYDGWIFYHEFMPFEAKFMEGRKSYNISSWRNSQPHQYDNLFYDHRIGAKPFFLMFWKPNNRILWLAEPFKNIIGAEKIFMEDMTEINHLEDLLRLMEVF